MTCPRCGSTGIHACPGEPIPAWTSDKVRELRAVLRQYEQPASRNQREGWYVGRLPGRLGQGRKHFRTRLRLQVGPDSATVPLMTRGSWILGEPPADWRPVARHRRFGFRLALFRRTQALRARILAERT